jgi:hypothetical protein
MILIIKGPTAVFMREAITTLATVFMAWLAGEEHKVSQFSLFSDRGGRV